ncbi:putative hydrolase [Pseudomonas phage pPa_SNUABM_DT01]|nr:putative hydrolase [Pseudomonas phage pPa_SNUABM_DT01]
MDIAELRNQIVTAFEEKWSINDKAHQQNHFEAVFQCGLKINERLNCGFDPKLILFAAYFHDLFAWSRVNHHELSFHWMMTTDHKVITDNLDPMENQLVAWACHQHRASFKGNFKYIFCELINSADREFPGNVAMMLERAVLYRQKNFPMMSVEQGFEDAVKHLKEKFGHGGYARYPDMYLKCFAEELEAQRDHIMAL